ncbi:hypothetical protein HN958_03660 [Candidatus Falkowbacteria bacterium]|mgnify:CR=1 FL=1|jgi:hypothetical protein|nr:hypothetical protein [Candidatus Falkowbacteria bacterium]MBT7007574.1 hypothetical protein [Candidatus Falkowbacteria bacterium]
MNKRFGGPEHFTPHVETGGMYEERIFGKAKALSQDLQERAGRLHMKLLEKAGKINSPSKKPGWIPFYDALRLAKQQQPWKNPNLPDKPVPGDLLDAIATKLNIADTPDDELLKFYTAVGTPLDTFHGTDALIEYLGTRVLMDITLDPVKKTFEDSDVFAGKMIMDELPEPEKDQEAYDLAIDKYAEFIVQAINRQLTEKKEKKLPNNASTFMDPNFM